MATGRTLLKYSRAFIDNHATLPSSQSFGPLVWEFDEIDCTAPVGGDAFKGYLPGHPRVHPGPYNAVMEGSGFFGTYLPPNSVSLVTYALGIRGEPAAGDPVFCGQFWRKSQTSSNDGGAVTVTIDFTDYDASDLVNYNKPWGILLHPSSAATAANSSTGIDQLASTSFGGYMVYHVSSSNGTATIKVQDAAVNVDGSFADVTGLTTGVTDFSSGGNGIVAAAATQTIRQFVRWQIVLGTASTITFVLSLVRRYGVGQ